MDREQDSVSHLAIFALAAGALSFVVCPLAGGIVALTVGLIAVRDAGANERSARTARAGWILGLSNILLVGLAVIVFAIVSSKDGDPEFSEEPQPTGTGSFIQLRPSNIGDPDCTSSDDNVYGDVGLRLAAGGDCVGVGPVVAELYASQVEMEETQGSPGDRGVRVHIKDKAARAALDRAARENFGKQMAVVFNRKIISSPTIGAQAFGSTFEISTQAGTHQDLLRSFPQPKDNPLGPVIGFGVVILLGAAVVFWLRPRKQRQVGGATLKPKKPAKQLICPGCTVSYDDTFVGDECLHCGGELTDFNVEDLRMDQGEEPAGTTPGMSSGERRPTPPKKRKPR